MRQFTAYVLSVKCNKSSAKGTVKCHGVKYGLGRCLSKRQLYLHCMYSGPCILRPPVQPEIYGLKLEVVLKWRDIYIENIRIVLLIAGLKMEVFVKWRGLKSQGPL